MMDAGQYARLLRDTIEQYGCPAIFNTDQGAQFTSDVFTSVLIEYGIEISMDGEERWITSAQNGCGEALNMKIFI